MTTDSKARLLNLKTNIFSKKEKEIVLFLHSQGARAFPNRTEIVRNVNFGPTALKLALATLLSKNIIFEKKGRQNSKGYDLTLNGLELAIYFEKD